VLARASGNGQSGARVKAASAKRNGRCATRHDQRGRLEGQLIWVLWDGRRGFLREPDLHRPIGYRMTFIRREDGTWLLGDYLAGD
jgi:hypothetical protein